MKVLNLSRLFFLSTFVIIVAFSGCSKRGQEQYPVTFLDSVKLYSLKFKSKIIHDSLRFPRGVHVFVATSDSIPPDQIGTFADSLLKTSLKHFTTSEEQENCVLLLVSKSPHLIQIRYGENIQLEAYKAGLSLGSKYLDYQENFIHLGNKKGLEYVLTNLAKELPPALDLSWIMRFQKPAVKTIYNDLSDLVTPSEDFYSKALVRPYVRLLISINFFDHPLILIGVNALILFLIVYIGRQILIFLFGTGKVGFIIRVIWRLIANLLFTIPFWASILVLSSYRMEDKLFYDYLKIPIPSDTTHFDSLTTFTPFWLALIIGVLVLGVEFLTNLLGAYGLQKIMDPDRAATGDLDDSSTDQVLQRTLERAFGLAFLALFMPRVISLLILFSYVIKIPSAISAILKLNRLDAESKRL